MSFVDRLKYLHLAYFAKPVADRIVFRTIRKLRPKSIVEIGLGGGERALRAITLAARCRAGERIAYTAIDLFEMSPKDRRSLGLKAAHQLLSATGAKIQLVPGDPFSALARMANNLTGTDLVIVSADQQGETLERAWFYLPRMLGDNSIVLVEEKNGEQTQFRALTKADMTVKARGDVKRRAA